MRYFLCKSNLVGLILAAMTAGVCGTPAVAATGRKQSEPAPVQKKAGSTTTHATRSNSSSSTTAKKKTTSTETKSATSSTAKKTGARSKASSRRRTKKVKGQEAPTPERISEIQDALASKGVFTDTPSGKWDDSTVGAMKKFQTSQGLAPTGKLDALTLQKLGLGSQTAGLAAPVAPPNSVNRLKNAPSALEEPASSEAPHN
jgi:peptidoglycan hydrolase-like protein with peptidoglycan-binding domain